MEQLANNGNGNYAYVDDLDEAQKLFVEDLTSTLQVIALDAKIQVDFNPDVVAYYRLIGYENRDVCRRHADFRNDAVDAARLALGTAPPPCTRSPSARTPTAASPPSNYAGRIPTLTKLPRSTATSTPGIWRRVSSRLIPATNWLWSSLNMLNCCVTVLGLLKPAAQLVEHAYRVSSLLWDDAEVTEFASLVSRASQIRALGN